MLGLKILLQKIQKSDNVKNEDFKKIRDFLKKLNSYDQSKVDPLLLDFVEFCIDNNKIKTKYAFETIHYIIEEIRYPKVLREIEALVTNSTAIKLKFVKNSKDKEEIENDLINYFSSRNPIFKRYLELREKFLKLDEIKRENKQSIIEFKKSLTKLINYYEEKIDEETADKAIQVLSNISKDQVQDFAKRKKRQSLSLFYYSYPITRSLSDLRYRENAKRLYFTLYIENFIRWVQYFEEDNTNKNYAFFLKEIDLKNENRKLIKHFYHFLEKCVKFIEIYQLDLSKDAQEDFTKLNFNCKKKLNKKALNFYISFFEYINIYANAVIDDVIQTLKKDNKKLPASHRDFFINDVLKFVNFNKLINLLKDIRDNCN